MKRLTGFVCAFLLALFPACASGTGEAAPSASSKTSTETTRREIMNIKLKIGTKTFTATLSDNEATRSLAALFPLTVDMSELNGNEYYAYLDTSLPTESKNPHNIKAGDIKLYGSNCLVIFYKSFSTSYSYTDLGTVDDTAGLLNALKASGGKVTFSLSE